MEDIINDFFQDRSDIIYHNKIHIENLHKKYIDHINFIYKKFAILYSILIDLEYNFENYDKNYIDNKHYKINEILTYLIKNIDNNVFCILRSPERDFVDMNLIKILTKYPSDISININNCIDKFYSDNKEYVSKIIDNKLHINIDENTALETTKQLIQLPKDSISIEYSDIFIYRMENGNYKIYKYNGINSSKINILIELFKKNINNKNISTSVSILSNLIKQLENDILSYQK